VARRRLTLDEWHDAQAARRYAIVAVEEACARTGLEREQLLELGAEELTRRFADGRREQALRLPAELVPDKAR